jgi:hypothetical protein
MCLFCLRYGADQEASMPCTKTCRKPSQVAVFMTLGADSVNAACSMGTEEEKEGCINVVKCEGTNDFSDRWRTSEAF